MNWAFSMGQLFRAIGRYDFLRMSLDNPSKAFEELGTHYDLSRPSKGLRKLLDAITTSELPIRPTAAMTNQMIFGYAGDGEPEDARFNPWWHLGRAYYYADQIHTAYHDGKIPRNLVGQNAVKASYVNPATGLSNFVRNFAVFWGWAEERKFLCDHINACLSQVALLGDLPSYLTEVERNHIGFGYHFRIKRVTTSTE